MARRAYDDGDRARVHTLLVTNEGNVDRTARETGIPPATVRLWKKKWEKDGPPTEVMERAVQEATDFVNQAMGTRFEAIVLLRAKLPEASARDLATIVGILDDKITRARGLATGRVEHVHNTPALPPPEELGQILGDYLHRAVGAARRRDAVVIDAEEPAQKALPAGG